MQQLNMKPNKRTGILITFCGLDGCGKTTIIKRLKSEFENRDVFLTKQPTDFVRSTDIFRTYQDEPTHDEYDYRSLSLLAASDRIQHTNRVIAPQLDKGKVVISDRYIYSCLANLRARGYKKDNWIYEISESLVEPDLAFFFDVPVKIAVSRVRSRPEEKDRYIDMKLQYKLRNEYKKICKVNGGILIPTTISEDETYEMVRDCVKRVLSERKTNIKFKETTNEHF